MLKPSEIRIGNLVTVNNPEHWPDLKDKPLEVIGINQCKPVEGRENTDYSIQLLDRKNYNQTYSQFICFIDPIQLNDNWLLKFGYSMYDSNSAGKVFEYIKEIGFVNDDLKIIYFSKTEKYMRRSLDLKHVHKVQNLYFELTDQELVLQD